MTKYNYQPEELSVEFSGIPLHNIFQKGNNLCIENDKPRYKESFDIHGNITRIVQKQLTTVTLSLINTSPLNKILNHFLRANSINGSREFNIIIKDTTGTILFSSSQAYVKNLYNSWNNAKEWIIDAGNVTEYKTFNILNPTLTNQSNISAI